jgi:hypothetical protein
METPDANFAPQPTRLVDTHPRYRGMLRHPLFHLFWQKKKPIGRGIKALNPGVRGQRPRNFTSPKSSPFNPGRPLIMPSDKWHSDFN